MRIKKKKKMSKRKLVFLLVFLAVLVSLSIYIYFNFFRTNTKVEEKTKVVDSIDKYGYTVNDNDTKLFKTKFKELKRTLNSDKLDNKKYSELVAELFVIDFFSFSFK